MDLQLATLELEHTILESQNIFQTTVFNHPYDA